MEIINYKLINFLNLPIEQIEKYIVALKYLKPRETKNQIYRMKLKDVEMIKQLLNISNIRDLITIISKVQDIKEKKVLDLKIIEFFRLVNSVGKQIKRILQAEENAFTPNEIDVKVEMVRSSERMAKFGIFNTLDVLTHKQPHLNDVYRNMRYDEIFTTLVMWKEEMDIQNEMNKLKIE